MAEASQGTAAGTADAQHDETAGRVVRIMRELSEKLCTAAVLHELDGNPALLRDPELASAWQRHHELEAAAAALVHSPAEPNAPADEQDEHPSPPQDTPALVALRDSSREICQLVVMRGVLRDALAGISSEPTLSATTKVFLELTEELSAITEEKLATSVGADSEHRRELEAALAQGERAEDVLRERQQTLRDAKARHAQESEQNAAQIARLREEIAEVENAAQVEAKIAQNEAKVRETNAARAFKDAELAFKAEKEKLEGQLDAKSRENKRKEQLLRKRKQRVEAEAAAWYGKFDHDMGDLDAEFRTVSSEFEKEHEELVKIEKTTAELSKIRDELEGEEQRRTQKLAREAEKKREMEEAARRIQRCWQRFKSKKDGIKKSKSLKKLKSTSSQQNLDAKKAVKKPGTAPSAPPSRGPAAPTSRAGSAASAAVERASRKGSASPQKLPEIPATPLKKERVASGGSSTPALPPLTQKEVSRAASPAGTAAAQ